MSKVVRVALATAVMAFMGASNGWTEPLVTQGIGISNCGQLAGDLKPGEGLRNSVNLMLYAWVQGYISAANLSLLDKESHHVDMSPLDASKVVSMVMTFCQANPDKKPVDAVDEFLRTAAKLETEWQPGTIRWNE